MAQLLKQGVSVLGLGKSLVAYRRRGGQVDMRSCRYFVTDGSKVFFQNSSKLEALDSGQMAFAFVLEMGSVRKSLEDEIRRIAAG
jgi:hypothetical protein